ncbi:hypothetical protein O0I10_005450 [Lichtheimia ornata]|uniref:Uncharacterized protein n=1 Tax=Lichtheimia ornata TaxID=688661 RepID=A0AAD7V560_9FUNG|nr:uncharacterized protein O0I10_005450 [Lichtheimia ornata]KAJ8658726.1 hypothetical protein O0I10_005450 [Lichtheimia ornata]
MGFLLEQCARLGQLHLVCQFHDQAGQSQISQMSPPAKLDPGVNLFDDDDQKNIFWASSDIEREAFTPGAVGQAEPIALFKTPRFIVKFGDTGTFMFSYVLGLANCTLCESFTIKLANPRIRNVATSQTGSEGRPLRRR